MKNKNEDIEDLYKKTWTEPDKIPVPPKPEPVEKPGKFHFRKPIELKTALLILLISVLTGLLIAFISEQITQRKKYELTTSEEPRSVHKEQLKGLAEEYKRSYGENYKR